MRIAVDTGGTFTDFVVQTSTGISRFKLPSTPDDPSRAIFEGCGRFSQFDLAHGTTVATNAILEGKTARTGLVVTEGFRDFLRLGRQTRPDLYAWEPRLPRLPVRDQDIRTVGGRLGVDGREIEPPRLPESLGLEGCDAVAVCLLYAYANPEHERRVANLLANGFVSLSHEVSPEMREYERACATVLNAAVGPIVRPYFEKLSGLSESVRIMASLGGLISLADASAMPIRTVVSGPAGGVAATKALGKRLCCPNTIAFDMGGTSTDVTLIRDHNPAMTACSDVAGLPIRLNRIDVHTVGCGGGSIAYLDEARALKVGPESAGADPGPALYGGALPTVTDADFVLGRLPLTRFAKTDGVNAGASALAISDLAGSLGLTLQQTAAAIVAVADAQMAAAVRKVSAERGFDPNEFSLVAFGGAGAMHACAVADLLDMKEILVPVGAGVFSALGLLGSTEVWESSRGVLGTDQQWDNTYHHLGEEALNHLSMDGETRRTADMRYRGQSHDLSVPAGDGREAAESAFHRLHQSTFGVAFEDREVQWVTARVRAEAATGDPVVLTLTHVPGEPVDGVVEREQLTGAFGPLVVIDDDCTIYLAGGWRCERLEDGTLRIYR